MDLQKRTPGSMKWCWHCHGATGCGCASRAISNGKGASIPGLCAACAARVKSEIKKE